MYHLCPWYKVPNRKYFSDTMMPNIYENLKEKVKDKLKNSAYIKRHGSVSRQVQREKSRVSLRETKSWNEPRLSDLNNGWADWVDNKLNR